MQQSWCSESLILSKGLSRLTYLGHFLLILSCQITHVSSIHTSSLSLLSITCYFATCGVISILFICRSTYPLLYISLPHSCYENMFLSLKLSILKTAWYCYRLPLIIYSWHTLSEVIETEMFLTWSLHADAASNIIFSFNLPTLDFFLSCLFNLWLPLSLILFTNYFFLVAYIFMVWFSYS